MHTETTVNIPAMTPRKKPELVLVSNESGYLSKRYAETPKDVIREASAGHAMSSKTVEAGYTRSRYGAAIMIVRIRE